MIIMKTVLKPHSARSIHVSEYNVTCIQSDLSIRSNRETYLLNNSKTGILYPEIENMYTL